MKVIFTELARAELADAAGFYELKAPGLGDRFKKEIKDAVSRIIMFPKGWSVEKGDIRRCLLHKFPYKILYSVEEDHILVIAIAHQHRKPDYWIDKLLSG